MVFDLKPDTFDVKFPSPDHTITEIKMLLISLIWVVVIRKKELRLKKCELVIVICTAMLMFHQCKNKTRQKYGF